MGYISGFSQCRELRTMQVGRSKTLDHSHAHQCQKSHDGHDIKHILAVVYRPEAHLRDH